MTRVVIVGGGPGGYESALVAAQLGADVTVVDRDGLGGSCVLTDCVPSKTLIATAELMTATADSGPLGVRIAGGTTAGVSVDLAAVNARVKALAAAQSADIEARLAREGGDLKLCCLSPRVRQIFALAGFDLVFQLCETRAKALASFAPAGGPEHLCASA